MLYIDTYFRKGGLSRETESVQGLRGESVQLKSHPVTGGDLNGQIFLERLASGSGSGTGDRKPADCWILAPNQLTTIYMFC